MLYEDELCVKKSSKRTSAEFSFTGNVVRGRQQGHEGIAYIITGFFGIDTLKCILQAHVQNH